MSTALYDPRETAAEEQSSDSLPASQKVGRGFRSSLLLQDIVISLSLANLCFLLVWQLVIALAGDGETQYFEMAPPGFGFVASLLADIGVGAVLVYWLIRVRRRSPAVARTPAAVCLAALCCFALLEIEQIVEQEFAPSYGLLLRIGTLILALLALLGRRQAHSLLRPALLLLSPLLPLLALNAAWLYSRPELKRLGTEPVAGKLPAIASHRRVIWIIFDELDYHLAFEKPPTRLRMPEFDRLRQISFSADHAQSPTQLTLLSLPSLLIGKRVLAEKHRASEISLRFEGASQWQDFSSQPNILRRARNASFNTAVDGWHHPYCRLLGNDLAACVNAQNGNQSIAFYSVVAPWPFWQRSLAIALWEAQSLTAMREFYAWTHTLLARRDRPVKRNAVASSAIAATPQESALAPLYRMANIRNRAVREQQIAAARLITSNAVRMALDPDLNLVFIHVPAPHLPGIWDSRTSQFTATGRSDYVDNLAFTDFFLGQVRRALEQTGQWDQTTLLISADHPFRPGMWQISTLWTPELAALTEGQTLRYVPFLLKLPGQNEAFAYHREFNTVGSSNLIWEILNGRIQAPQQAANWLDTH